MKIQDHPLFVEWAKFVKEHGGCIQCQYPWYDGTCECKFGEEHIGLGDAMCRFANSLICEKNEFE